MREIKFRAFDKKGRFDTTEVLIIDFKDNYVIVDAEWNKDPETGEADCMATFDEVELMQYTGLKDKNGKEIFEGDVVRVIALNSVVKEERTGVDLVVKDFLSMYKSGNDWIFEAPSSATEVIGNIYENPELLKENK